MFPILSSKSQLEVGLLSHVLDMHANPIPVIRSLQMHDLAVGPYKFITVYTNISFISLLPLIKQNLRGFKLTQNPAKVTSPRGETDMRVHNTSCDPSLKLHSTPWKKF